MTDEDGEGRAPATGSGAADAAGVAVFAGAAAVRVGGPSAEAAGGAAAEAGGGAAAEAGGGAVGDASDGAGDASAGGGGGAPGGAGGGAAGEFAAGGSGAEMEGAGEGPGGSVPRPVGAPAGRGRGLAMDMVRSLGLVALVLLAWLLFSHPRTPDGIATVDWRPTVQSAAATARFPVLAPASSWSWQATSSRIEPQPDGTISWRVGFYTPAEDYAALLQRGVFPAQASGSRQEWIDTETRQGQAAGTVQIAGRTWTRLEGDPSPDERRSLLSSEGGTVTVITGTADWSELEALAGALQVHDQPG